MKDLPKFKPRKRDDVIRFVSLVFSRPNQPDESAFRRLVEYEDGHYRAVFSLSFFAADAPTKSQWNSLKKKLKRHDKQLFVFKEYGLMACEESDLGSPCGYVEFGFFARPVTR